MSGSVAVRQGHLCLAVMPVGSLEVSAGSCYSNLAHGRIVFLPIGAAKEFRTLPTS